MYCDYYMLNIGAFQESHTKTRMLVHVKSYVKKMCLQQFPKNTNVSFSMNVFGQ